MSLLVKIDISCQICVGNKLLLFLLESKDDSSMINLASLEIATPTTPLESEFSYPGISGDDIEARLVAIKGKEEGLSPNHG